MSELEEAIEEAMTNGGVITLANGVKFTLDGSRGEVVETAREDSFNTRYKLFEHESGGLILRHFENGETYSTMSAETTPFADAQCDMTEAEIQEVIDEA